MFMPSSLRRTARNGYFPSRRTADVLPEHADECRGAHRDVLKSITESRGHCRLGRQGVLLDFCVALGLHLPRAFLLPATPVAGKGFVPFFEVFALFALRRPNRSAVDRYTTVARDGG